VEVRFLLAGTPKEDVECIVTVHPENEAWANGTRLTFRRQAGFDQIEASLTITGQPDWKSDGDAPYAVRLGPCASADRRFNDIGFPQQPAVTSILLVNQDMPLPFVKALVPSMVHISGRVVTVHGTDFGPDCKVYFCGLVLGHSAAQPKKWMWVYNNASGRYVPLRSAALAAKRYVVRRNGSVTIDDSDYNATLCDAMAQEGPLPNCTMDTVDFQQAADADLSGLLQFRYVSDSVLTFMTPCLSLSQVCRP
jgi:hypothetical protein